MTITIKYETPSGSIWKTEQEALLAEHLEIPSSIYLSDYQRKELVEGIAKAFVIIPRMEMEEAQIKPEAQPILNLGTEKKPGQLLSLRIAGIDFDLSYIPASETLSCFWMMQTAVTNSMFLEIAGVSSEPGTEDFPAVNISFKDAVEFCTKLNQAAMQEGYKGTFYIPFEEEWEHACRAGTTTAYNYGDEPDASKMNSAPSRGLKAVKSYPPNSWSLYEMHGNVWEMALPSTLEGTVLRGGSSNDNPDYARSADRLRLGADIRNYYVGFRLAYKEIPQ